MDNQIIRKLWRAAVSPENVEIFRKKALGCTDIVKDLTGSGKILGMSLFLWERHVFLYYECIDCMLEPDALLGETEACLEKWPGETKPRSWVELVDVFHFNQPVGLAHWKRKSPVDKHIGKIGRLKPECIPHYMFYHYALQEERAFGGDKYQILGINENILFGYFELPAVIEEPATEPRIKTCVVPKNWADAGISACFIPWPDMPDVRLRPMEEVLSIW